MVLGGTRTTKHTGTGTVAHPTTSATLVGQIEYFVVAAGGIKASRELVVVAWANRLAKILDYLPLMGRILGLCKPGPL